MLRSAPRTVATFGRWGNYDGQFMMAHDIALSPNGDIYVGDISGQRIQKLRWTNARTNQATTQVETLLYKITELDPIRFFRLTFIP